MKEKLAVFGRKTKDFLEDNGEAVVNGGMGLMFLSAAVYYLGLLVVVAKAAKNPN